MAETFQWSPRPGVRADITFRRLVAQFGDGYRQVASDGINNKVQSWPLTFVGDADRIAAIESFLDRHAGMRSFLWTPPRGVEGWYEVASYSPSHVEGVNWTITATFQQVFKP